jgi:hypothetical protein
MRFALRISVLAMVAALAVAGCGKKPGARQETETASELVDAAPYVPNAAPGTLIQTRITGCMHAFHEANRRWPSDFNELVTAKLLDKLPAPPPGKKFVFDKKSLQVLVVPE